MPGRFVMSSRLTDEEKRILASVSGSTDSGELYMHQEEMLEQLRGAMRYLQEKYPGIRPDCRMFDPLSRISENGLMLFSAGDREVYKVIITMKDNTYHYADTLYSAFVRERYDASLEELLSGSKTHTVFHTPCGTDIGKDAPAEKLNAHEPVLVRHTDIYTDGNFDAERVMEVLKKNRYCGSYTVYRQDREIMHFNISDTEVQQEDA